MQNAKNTYLNPYHELRHKEAIEGVKKMQEQPLTREQFIAQVNQIKEDTKKYHSPK